MYIYTDIFNNIKFYKNQETNLKISLDPCQQIGKILIILAYNLDTITNPLESQSFLITAIRGMQAGNMSYL